MPSASFVRSVFICYFSSPKRDRPLYRSIRKLAPQAIVEIGVDITRARRVLELAAAPGRELQYTGVDLFESRDDSALSLKEAHRELTQLPATVRLMPGELFPALSRAGNVVGTADLIIIDARYRDAEIAAASSALARICSPATKIARFHTKTKLGWQSPDIAGQEFRRAA